MVDYLAHILYTLQGANWQRSRGKGEKPKAPKPPVDQQLRVKTKEQLSSKRRSAAEHLRKRRAERKGVK